MNHLKFSGILAEILERYPNIDISEFLQQELQIPLYKAEELAARIENYCQKATDKPVQNLVKPLLEKPSKPENSTKTNTYAVECFSEEEFEQFIVWLFKELGYDVHEERFLADLGVDLVAEKDGEKIAVQARRYPKTCRVSDSIVLLSLEAMRAYECSRSIVAATTHFTEQAKADAKKCGIELWDSDALDEKITDVR